MEKLEKVIAALERCADLDRRCCGCDYEDAEYCEVALMRDAQYVLRELDGKYRAAVEMAAAAEEQAAAAKRAQKAARLQRNHAWEKLVRITGAREAAWLWDTDKIYPLTVVCDRYTGTYSGGAYTAWNLDPWDLPQEIDSDDVSCREFWDDEAADRYAVGKGATAMEAIVDLARKMEVTG